MSSLSTRSTRFRWIVALVIAFGGGLLFASSMDWTRLGFAQSKPSLSEVRPLAETGEAFVSISDHVTPAVVSIQVDSKVRSAQNRMGQGVPRGMLPPGFDDFFNFETPQQAPVQEASGSGFLVTTDGYILTNNHVVTGPDQRTVADKITVKLLDHRAFPARVVGTDPTTDLAVVKIDGGPFPTIPIGNDNNTRVGEWVLAVGNPLGLDFTVTAGIVSAKGRNISQLLRDNYAVSDLIQTDAAINPGNSGGPLVNIRGEVIGVNSAIASQTGYYSGYGFAIPITLAKKVMDDIIAHGRVRFGVLGVGIDEVRADDAAAAGMKEVRGAKVQNFQPDTDENPSRKAGLQPGDIIISADGRPVDRVSSLQRIVRDHAPGETIKIDVMRYGQRKTFDVKLMDRPGDASRTASTRSGSGTPAAPSSAKLGVSLRDLPTQAQRPQGFPARGVLVQDVEPLGPSYGKLYQNDVITEILSPGARRPVTSLADLQSALSKIEKGQYISLYVAAQSQQGWVSRVVNIQVGS